MKLPIDPKTLTDTSDDQTIIAPCLSFTLWFYRTDLPVLLDFYERSVEALGPQLTHYIAESMKYPAKITSRSRTMVPTWLKKPAEFKYYNVEFRGAAEINPASLKVVFTHLRRLTSEQEARFKREMPELAREGAFNEFRYTVFRVTFPLDHSLAEPERFSRWVLDFEAVKRGEFTTGGCDIALNDDGSRLGGDIPSKVRGLCTRHPGLDWFYSSLGRYLQRYEPERAEVIPLVKRAGWITLVSEKAVTFLGGEEKVSASVSGDPSIRVYRLGHGLALQAGEAPQLGDITRGEIPGAYRTIAKALRPVRLERVGTLAGYNKDWVKEWLETFDREPEAAR
jgi:hypothetical protein